MNFKKKEQIMAKQYEVILEQTLFESDGPPNYPVCSATTLRLRVLHLWRAAGLPSVGRRIPAQRRFAKTNSIHALRFLRLCELMCTAVPFDDVVVAIAEDGFRTSPYPIIISLEVHCSTEQQARLLDRSSPTAVCSYHRSRARRCQPTPAYM